MSENSQRGSSPQKCDGPVAASGGGVSALHARTAAALPPHRIRSPGNPCRHQAHPIALAHHPAMNEQCTRVAVTDLESTVAGGWQERRASRISQCHEGLHLRARRPRSRPKQPLLGSAVRHRPARPDALGASRTLQRPEALADYQRQQPSQQQRRRPHTVHVCRGRAGDTSSTRARTRNRFGGGTCTVQTAYNARYQVLFFKKEEDKDLL